MIEVEMPKDISKVETKYMGLVTSRQAIGLVCAVFFTIIMRKIVGPSEELKDLKSILTIVTAGVPLAFAVYRPYGMSMYEFCVQYLYTNLLSPKKRLYKVENVYEKYIEEDKKHEDFIVYQYDRIHGIKHRNAKIDTSEMPRVKKNKQKSLTGYV